MTNRELKSQLKTAYIFDESKEETAFIRTHEQRSLHLWDIILDEFRFLGWQSILSGVILCAVLLLVSVHNRTSTIWCLSSFLPLLVLLMTALIGRSERYGMSELEAVCRFSLRFVRLIRMLILGTVSLMLLFAGTLIAQRNDTGGFAVAMCYVSFPYLLNVFINLLITRKWHSKEDIFFCAGATGFSCLVPSIARALNIIKISNTFAVVLIVIILAAAITESIKYIQEGDKIIWNLC